MVEVKALACELPSKLGIPLSRFSSEEIKRYVLESGIVASISGITIWRWLSKDAIKPWQHRSWIFPRDPEFAGKAGPILDLYQGKWEGIPLGSNDYVVSTDEKTSIHARISPAIWNCIKTGGLNVPSYSLYFLPKNSA